MADPICGALNSLPLKLDSPLWIIISASSIAMGLIFKKNIFGWKTGELNVAIGALGLGAAAYQHFICKT